MLTVQFLKYGVRVVMVAVHAVVCKVAVLVAVCMLSKLVQYLQDSKFKYVLQVQDAACKAKLDVLVILHGSAHKVAVVNQHGLHVQMVDAKLLELLDVFTISVVIPAVLCVSVAVLPTVLISLSAVLLDLDLEHSIV